MEIFFNNKFVFKCSNDIPSSDFTELVISHLNLLPDAYYLLQNGKRITLFDDKSGRIEIVPRLRGGKGGFGSMLRAIGAQIEKTTNREACRDLSGRRLRDINEEKRLKTWIAQQAEREKEAVERKQKKLERLCQEPKHEFKDENYDKLRSVLPEKVEDAVLQGLKASCTATEERKRKSNDNEEVVKSKKKKKLWFDEELSASDEDSDTDEEKGDTNGDKEVELSVKQLKNNEQPNEVVTT